MIVKDNDISFGQPTIKGRRLTVHNVVTGIYNDGLEQYLKDMELSINEAKEAITYCLKLECQTSKNGKFCGGCILSSLQDGWDINEDDFEVKESDGMQIVVHKKSGSVYFGTINNYKDDLFGNAGWGIAHENVNKYPELGNG